MGKLAVFVPARTESETTDRLPPRVCRRGANVNARAHAGARTGTSASELSRVALAAAGKCSRPALQKALNLRCKVRPSRARFAATRRKATRQHDRAHYTSIYPSALMRRPPRLNATPDAKSRLAVASAADRHWAAACCINSTPHVAWMPNSACCVLPVLSASGRSASTRQLPCTMQHVNAHHAPVRLSCAALSV